MSRPGPGAGPSRVQSLTRVVLVGLPVGGFALWVLFLWLRRDDPATWQKDWYCFYSAGSAFLERGTEGVYWRECIEGHFWLYPPYMLYPYALASLIPPLYAYALIVVAIVALTVIGLGLLRDALADAERFETIAAWIIGSNAFFATLVMGQHSALLLFGIAAGLRAIARGRHFEAGLFLGLLGVKPNLAVVFVLWLLVARRWRTLAGMSLAGAVLIATTIPMGVGVWREYLVAAPHWVGDLLDAGGEFSYPAHKLVTFEAFTRSTLGVVSPVAGEALWVVLELLAAAACLVVWLRSDRAEDQVAIAVLAAVAANMYVEFYDALLLAVPAAIWWTHRERYPPASWKAAGVAAAASWLWMWLWFIGSTPRWPSLVGGFLALWIVAEAARALVRPRALG